MKALLVFLVACSAAPTAIPWARSIGGNGLDIVTSVASNSDDSVLVAGNTTASFANGTHVWLVCMAADGSVRWQQRLADRQSASNAQVAARKGGYFVAATTFSDGAGKADLWLLSINDDGSIAWQEAMGGLLDDKAAAIKVDASGDPWVFATSDSFGDGDDDWLLVQVNATDGAVVQAQTYGDTDAQEAAGLAFFDDGSLVLSGTTTHQGNADVAIAFVQSSGVISSVASYGGPGNEQATAADVQGKAFTVLATTSSFGAGGTDAWVLQGTSGKVATQRVLGDVGDDTLVSVHSGWALGTTVVNANTQVWLVALTSGGGIGGQQAYGGAGVDNGIGFGQRSNGDLWFGATSSSFGNTAPDFWAVLLDASLELETLGAQSKAKIATTAVVPAPLSFGANTLELTVTPTQVLFAPTTARVTRQVGD